MKDLAPCYREIFSKVYREYIRLTDEISVNRGLVLGYGRGPELPLIARKFPLAYFSGVDLDPLAQDAMRSVLAKHGISNVSLMLGNIEEISQTLDGDTFNLSICFLTLHLLQDSAYASRHWSNHVSSGGNLITVDWSRDGATPSVGSPWKQVHSKEWDLDVSNSKHPETTGVVIRRFKNVQ